MLPIAKLLVRPKTVYLSRIRKTALSSLKLFFSFLFHSEQERWQVPGQSKKHNLSLSLLWQSLLAACYKQGRKASSVHLYIWLGSPQETVLTLSVNIKYCFLTIKRVRKTPPVLKFILMLAPFFSRAQRRMLQKYCSKLFLVQENFEHNTRYHWEWHVTVVAHFVLSSLLGSCLSLHHPRNWNHGKGTERIEKHIIPHSGSCSPEFPHLPSPLTTLAPFQCAPYLRKQ